VQEQGLENKFQGQNFVFDERMGERIAEEIISTCHLCKAEKSDTHYHCQNQIYQMLFIGCDSCVAKKKGYCTFLCCQLDKLPDSTKKILARHYNLKMRKIAISKDKVQGVRTRNSRCFLCPAEDLSATRSVP
jgi:predicted sulfurtransferase